MALTPARSRVWCTATLKAKYVGPGRGSGECAVENTTTGCAQRISVTPSPAVQTARIRYGVIEAGSVEIAVHDAAGRVVLHSNQGARRSGAQTDTVCIAGLAAGTYIATVTVNGVSASKAFVVLK